MQKSGAKAYLVNTGWNGTGKRISIKDTRGIIDAILSGAILNAPTKKIPYFNFEVPTELSGVDPKILDPRDTYADASQWDEKAKDLAPASSRTSSSTKATKPARRWSPQARRLSNCIFSEQAAAMRPVFYCRKIPSGFSGNRTAVRCSHGSSACGRRTLRGFFAHRNGLAMRLRIPCHAKFSAPRATIFPSKLV